MSMRADSTALVTFLSDLQPQAAMRATPSLIGLSIQSKLDEAGQPQSYAFFDVRWSIANAREAVLRGKLILVDNHGKERIAMPWTITSKDAAKGAFTEVGVGFPIEQFGSHASWLRNADVANVRVRFELLDAGKGERVDDKIVSSARSSASGEETVGEKSRVAVARPSANSQAPGAVEFRIPAEPSAALTLDERRWPIAEKNPKLQGAPGLFGFLLDQTDDVALPLLVEAQCDYSNLYMQRVCVSVQGTAVGELEVALDFNLGRVAMISGVTQDKTKCLSLLNHGKDVFGKPAALTTALMRAIGAMGPELTRETSPFKAVWTKSRRWVAMYVEDNATGECGLVIGGAVGGS